MTRPRLRLNAVDQQTTEWHTMTFFYASFYNLWNNAVTVQDPRKQDRASRDRATVGALLALVPTTFGDSGSFRQNLDNSFPSSKNQTAGVVRYKNDPTYLIRLREGSRSAHKKRPNSGLLWGVVRPSGVPLRLSQFGVFSHSLSVVLPRRGRLVPTLTVTALPNWWVCSLTDPGLFLSCRYNQDSNMGTAPEKSRCFSLHSHRTLVESLSCSLSQVSTA
ncbi:hypothetical protein EDB92DRAFT_504129 [Lactarius akahatsu]|uniref:Uncharacterized protein n=1 Tax=Lactarius akahatsu TaxID=416441 RepID=A0AAD4QFB4_9AGAM|nr:hypothetical protein EDB92DRAFT_504129 [Lactarius akahatsu]